MQVDDDEDLNALFHQNSVLDQTIVDVNSTDPKQLNRLHQQRLHEQKRRELERYFLLNTIVSYQ